MTPLALAGLLPGIASPHASDLANAAIERAASNADARWYDRAIDAVRALALEADMFTSDDLWHVIGDDVQTHERRAIGAVLRDGARQGWIAATAEYTPSIRPECHARPVRVWRSLIRGAL